MKIGRFYIHLCTSNDSAWAYHFKNQEGEIWILRGLGLLLVACLKAVR